MPRVVFTRQRHMECGQVHTESACRRDRQPVRRRRRPWRAHLRHCRQLPRVPHAERPRRNPRSGPLQHRGEEASFLRDSLTRPKPDIPEGYQPVKIVTTDGKSIHGILRNEHNFSLQVLSDKGELHLLARDEVRDIEYSKQSLMPANYDKTFGAADLGICSRF